MWFGLNFKADVMKHIQTPKFLLVAKTLPSVAARPGNLSYRKASFTVTPVSD